MCQVLYAFRACHSLNHYIVENVSECSKKLVDYDVQSVHLMLCQQQSCTQACQCVVIMCESQH